VVEDTKLNSFFFDYFAKENIFGIKNAEYTLNTTGLLIFIYVCLFFEW
jgi:hypothetical protein